MQHKKLHPLVDGVLGLGIGDWGLGIGDWGLGIGKAFQCAMPYALCPMPNA
ncbi:MAG: hypothetical protein HEQ35_18775 [Gloeotrichia echinulata IR180]